MSLTGQTEPYNDAATGTALSSSPSSQTPTSYETFPNRTITEKIITYLKELEDVPFFDGLETNLQNELKNSIEANNNNENELNRLVIKSYEEIVSKYLQIRNETIYTSKYINYRMKSNYEDLQNIIIYL